MEISICVAKIVLEDKTVTLTPKIARQFPVLRSDYRIDQAIAGQDAESPICKVSSHVLGDIRIISDWVYLIAVHGEPAWVRPAVFSDKYGQAVIEHGGWIDHPELVRTVVLM